MDRTGGDVLLLIGEVAIELRVPVGHDHESHTLAVSRRRGPHPGIDDPVESFRWYRVGGVIAHHAAFADDLVEFHPPMLSLARDRRLKLIGDMGR